MRNKLFDRLFGLLILGLLTHLCACAEAQATVLVQNNSVSYACNGVQAAFQINFPFQTQGTIYAYNLNPGGGGVPPTQTLLVNGTDYVINLYSTLTTATLTLLSPSTGCANTHTLFITRSVPYEQTTSFITQGQFYPAVFEMQFDDVVYQIQQLANGGLDGGFSGIATSLGAGALKTDTTLAGDGTVSTPLGVNLAHSNTWTVNQIFGSTVCISGALTADAGEYVNGSLYVDGGVTAVSAPIGTGGSFTGGTSAGDGVAATATASGANGITAVSALGKGGVFTSSIGIGAVGNGGVNGAGVAGNGGPDGGPGGVFTGGADGGVGVVAIGSNFPAGLGSDGIDATGGVNAIGGVFLGGAGVQAQGLADGGAGVGGEFIGSADSSGVQAYGNGPGDGIDATASNSGVGAKLTGNSTGAPLLLTPRAAPSAKTPGSAYADTTLGWMTANAAGTAWVRVPFGRQVVFSSSTTATATVESGSFGCVCVSSAHTYTAQCAIASTTLTVTSGTSNSDIWNCVYF